MQLHETPIAGAYLLETDPRYDERGFFTCLWNTVIGRSLSAKDLFNECNLSFTRNRATIRGLHYQTKPHDAAKVVRCIRGALYHVIVDLRPESRTYLTHYAIVLRFDKYQSLYIPEGMAHGFQSLTDHCEAMYHTNNNYHAAPWHGIRWDDPALAIQWPLPISSVAKRDRLLPHWHH